MLASPPALAQTEDGILPAGPRSEPFRHQGGHDAVRPRRVVGPAAGGRKGAPTHAGGAERVEQSPPALAVRSGERALRPGCRAEAPRVRSLQAPPPPRTLATQRAPLATGSRRGAHRGAEVEHRLIERPRVPRRDEPVPELHRLAHGKRSRPPLPGPTPARRWCRSRPRRHRRRTSAPPEPYRGRRRGGPAAPRPRAGPTPPWSATMAAAARCRFSARRL